MKGKIFKYLLVLILLVVASAVIYQMVIGKKSNHSTARIFLIPSNYNGILRIVYSDSCAPQPKLENGKQVFRFEKNGFLLLNTDIDFSRQDSFYLVDNAGKRIQITEVAKFEDRLNHMPALVNGGVVVTNLSSTVTENGTTTTGTTCMDFYLYNTDSTKIADTHFSSTLDSLTKTVVGACNGNKTKIVAAAQDDWNYIEMKDIVSNDTTVKNGYTLIFINKSPTLDVHLKQRLTDAFFTVYPQEVSMYNKHSPKKVIFLVDPKFTGLAATASNLVRFNPAWFDGNPNDIDVVTHEVMHIVQGYGYDAGVFWLTEGIADYVRYKMGVDNAGGGWSLTPFNDAQNYTNAYRITARFFVWIENTHDKNLVQQMDAALRAHTYNASLWKEYTGKTVDELWSEYAKNPVI